MPLHQISVTPVDRAKRLEDKGGGMRHHEAKETYHVTSPTPPSAAERCSSRASTLSYSRDFCRICHCEGDSDVPLISPCYCAGSLRYVHQACLQQWIKSSDIRCCELCKFTFIMQTKTKPFSMWERLDMASSERRKLLCSVTFHVVALTCVVWSLYVLIERTTEEVHSGALGWPFWTKLIVVAIGVTGGVVFMYVQCKVYAQLCRRWRAYNRVIFVQNVPEKVPPPPADLEGGRVPAAPPPAVGLQQGGGGEWAVPVAAAAAGSRRVSSEDAGRVHVTIERSLSGALVLPPIPAAAAPGGSAPLSPPGAPLSPLSHELDQLARPRSEPGSVDSETDTAMQPPVADAVR